jgi:hypothetical protein
MAPDNDEPIPLRGDPGQSEMRHHPRPPLLPLESNKIDVQLAGRASRRLGCIVVAIIMLGVLITLLVLWRLGNLPF